MSLVENLQAGLTKTEPEALLADNGSKVIEPLSVEATSSALGSVKSVSSSGLPQPADELALIIESGLVDYEMSPRPFSASFDQDKNTFWKANFLTNQPHSLVYWLKLDTASDLNKLMRIRIHSGESTLMHYAPRRFSVFVSNDPMKPLAPGAASISLLRRLQRERPGDFWSNYALSHALVQNGSQSREEALRFATAAVALRPKDSAAHANVIRVLGRGLELNTDLSMQQLVIQHARSAKELNPKNQFTNQLSEEFATKGRDLLRGRQYDASISCFRLALELDPKNVFARQVMARSLNIVGQQAEAIAEFRKTEQPLNFGDFLHGIGKLDDAENAYRQAVELAPLEARGHTALAKVLALQGKTNEAQAEERIAEELEQKDRERYPLRYGARGPEQKSEDEIAALRLTLEANPKDLPALQRLVLLLTNTKQNGEAISLLQSRMEVLQDKPHFVWRLADLLFQENRIDEAIEMYRKSIELGDVSYVTYLPEGERTVDSPQLVKSRYASNHARLGNALDIQGKQDEAKEHYQRSLEYNPFAAEELVGFTQEGRLAHVRLADWMSAIRLQPRLVEAHIGMGWALAAQGKAEAARAKFREAIELAPKFACVQESLAWGLATKVDEQMRDPELAVEFAERACSLAPKREAYTYWNTLGVSQYYAGNYAAAVEALLRSIELRNQDASKDMVKVDRSTDWFFMAMAHWRLGDRSVALEYYDKAVAWMKQNSPKDSVLIRFKAEAAALLGREPEAPEANSDTPAPSPLTTNDPTKGNVP